MEINLLGGELIIKICYQKDDEDFDDNICISFLEPCSEEARVFRASETNLFITAQEARDLAKLLLKAAETSDLSSHDSV